MGRARTLAVASTRTMPVRGPAASTWEVATPPAPVVEVAVRDPWAKTAEPEATLNVTRTPRSGAAPVVDHDGGELGRERVTGPG